MIRKTPKPIQDWNHLPQGDDMTSAHTNHARSLAPLLALLFILGLAGCGEPMDGTSGGIETTPDAHHHAGHSHGEFHGDWAPDHPHFEECMHPTGANPLQRTDHVVAVQEPAAPSDGTWPVLLGGTGADKATALALDPDGRVVVGGTMRDTFTLGDETLEATVVGGDTAFTMSFEPNGAPAWSGVIGSSNGHTHLDDLAICPTGRVIACGGKQKPLTHGDIVEAEGEHGIYVAEWKPDGTPSWLHVFEGGMNTRCGGMAIEHSFDLESVGHTVAAFVHEGRLNLVRISHDGTLEYHETHGHGLKLPAPHVSAVQGVSTDSKGGVWVAGMFMGGGERSVGGDALTATGTSAVFLARYDIETGEHLWSNSWGSPAEYSVVGFDRATDITGIGEVVFISGVSLPGIDFGMGALGGLPDGNKGVGFIAAFDLGGTPLWSWVPADDDGEALSTARTLASTPDDHLAVLLGDHLMRLDPSDGWVHGLEPISSGAQAMVIDEDGMAVLAYELYNTSSFGEWELSSAGHADIVIDRVELP